MRKLTGCPGVVGLEEVINERLYHRHFVMELCECSLAEKIETKGRLNEPEAALLIRDLAKTVQDLHARGVLHRDLKPANILLGLDGKPRVADFGMAACFRPSSAPCFAVRKGTPGYAAPELVVVGSYSTHIDIWGLGLILYESLTALPPYIGLKDWHEIHQRMRQGQDLAATYLDWPHDVSQDARKLVLAMLRPLPAERITLEQILCHPWVLNALCEEKSKLPHDHQSLDDSETECCKEIARVMLPPPQRLQAIRPCALAC